MNDRRAPIGVFDSGSGGLTVLQALTRALPQQPFIYLGDHAHVPYGNRPREEIKELTAAAVAALFEKGCRLVILACNTATAVALQWLQREWLPSSPYAGTHNVLGVIVPLVEAVTGQDWYLHQHTPNTAKAEPETILLFATVRTVASQVFETELHKRAPHIQIVSEAIPRLVTLIERQTPLPEIQGLIRQAVKQAMHRALRPPSAALLGCTHYPLVEELFTKALPPSCPVYDQPDLTTRSLQSYLAKHPEYLRMIGPQSFALRMTTELFRAEKDFEQFFGRHCQLYSTKVWQPTDWLQDYLSPVLSLEKSA